MTGDDQHSNGFGSQTATQNTDVTVDKHIRYDRGIRIWGIHGQSALEQAKICLLNCSATGAEALKNMVLGGINAFTIVDDSIVTEEDLGTNFMLHPSSLGQMRAKVVTECLRELNDHVDGSYVEDSPRNVIVNKPSFFEDYSIIIGTQLAEHDSIALDAICRRCDIPVVYARTYGLSGMLRNSVIEHCVIESKPESSVHDYRFGHPWPELEKMAMEMDLDGLDEAEHSHVPYGVLLVRAIGEWKRRHPGVEMPESADERREFKALVKSWQRQIDGCPIPEENFDEALSNVNKVWGPKKIPPEIMAIFDDEKCRELSVHSSNFWIMCAALRKFTENTGQGHLPVCPTLPDMHSTTSRYLELQQVYKDRFAQEVRNVHQHCVDIMNSFGIDPSRISYDLVKTVCLHVRTLRVVRTKPVLRLDEPSTLAVIKSLISCEGKGPAAAILVLLRCVDSFHEQHKRFPGEGMSADREEDAALLKHILAASTDSMFTSIESNEDVLFELVRSGGAELHCVASVMGAMASQEVIKLLTGQCVPLGGTLIYDAMNCSTTTFDIY